jgi:hypothetical protein
MHKKRFDSIRSPRIFNELNKALYNYNFEETALLYISFVIQENEEYYEQELSCLINPPVH